MSCLKKHIALIGALVFALLFSACAEGRSVDSELSAVSIDEPSVALWVALKAEENTVADSAYTVQVSFGAGGGYSRYVVTVTSEVEDFAITKTCPDEYNVNGVEYNSEDFYVLPTHPVTFEKLPQKFTVSLLPIYGNGIYSGQVEIAVRGYTPDGSYGTAKVYLYYYGYDKLVCFSSKSVEKAKSLYLKQSSVYR